MWRITWYQGRWYASATINGKTLRRSLRTKDRGVAERNLQDFLIQSRPDRKIVKDIVEAYIEDKGYNKDHPILYHWKACKPFFGNLSPDQINRNLCRQYIESRNVSNGTIRKELGLIKTALNWNNPNHEAVFTLPPSPPPKEAYITKEQRDLLIENASSYHIKLFITLALATAARKSAILELRWKDIDFKKGLIYLSKGETHNKKRATVPMTNTAKKMLLEAREGSETDYVIEYNGKPVKDIQIAFRRLCKKVGLKGITPHSLRHSAAVWMAEAGISMDEIAQYLGHSSPRITYQVYARYSPDYLRKAASALE